MPSAAKYSWVWSGSGVDEVVVSVAASITAYWPALLTVRIVDPSSLADTPWSRPDSCWVTRRAAGLRLRSASRLLSVTGVSSRAIP